LLLCLGTLKQCLVKNSGIFFPFSRGKGEKRTLQLLILSGCEVREFYKQAFPLPGLTDSRHCMAFVENQVLFLESPFALALLGSLEAEATNRAQHLFLLATKESKRLTK